MQTLELHLTWTGKIPIEWKETTKISYYNLSFFVCSLSHTRGLDYRVKKEEKKQRQKWFGHNFADLCVYIIVVCIKWDGLHSHTVVTPTRII